ncbi:hypothetical protein RBU61_16945 [Tissierella sp. MB52-C2]|uniref:hypothetical protein n=1 Tax=Tissierella sp. MB52-C2 TaxID=3070999 RepID=UPI00280A8947|nr:hypothetical protein [Tissierella sp. MB52-C2]WMM24598.1 hypothetical protein RBU61_16945 [Tissierella sp. MB52-C2]
MNKKVSLILSILVIIYPFLLTGSITGNYLVEPMNYIAFIMKVLCFIIGVHFLNKYYLEQ